MQTQGAVLLDGNVISRQGRGKGKVIETLLHIFEVCFQDEWTQIC